MKRTNLVTYQFGECFRVYEDTDGRLYYRFNGQLHGTFIEYCYVLE